MTDQAAALRGLVDRQAKAVYVDDAPAEIWALAGGAAGVGVRTIARNMAWALENLGRVTRVWDYSSIAFADDRTELQSGEIVLALLGNETSARSIWNIARHALLIAQLAPRSLVEAYARLEQLGVPQRSSKVGLVFNDVVQADQVAKLHSNFDQSTLKFMQTRTALVGMVPRAVQWKGTTKTPELFAVATPPAQAIRSLVHNLLHEYPNAAQVSRQPLTAGVST